MHDGVKAECRSHDADGEAEIAGAADGDGVRGKQRACLVGQQFERIAARYDQPVPDRKVFGVGEYLVNAAARLD